MSNWTEIDDAMQDNITDELFAKYYETAALTVSQKRDLINKASEAATVVVDGNVDPETWRHAYYAVLDVIVERKAQDIYETVNDL